MASIREHAKHLWRSAAAVPHTFAEYFRFRRDWNKIKDKLPEGDGHPVLVLPGMMTGDFFYKTFRRHIDEKGYKAYTWNNGVNMGLSDKTAEHLRARLEEVYKDSGNKKITIIGHSLGGIFARELAREYPEMVRDVITMASPFGGMTGGDGVPQLLRKIFNLFSGKKKWDGDPAIHNRGLTPPPVPVTSVFSNDDPIIRPHASLNPAAAQAENIEVGAKTHMGIPFRRQSVIAIFDRLAQKEGEWKPFDPAAYKDLAAFSPAPAELPQNPGWAADAKSSPIFKK